MLEGVLFASHTLVLIIGIAIGFLIGLAIGEHEANKGVRD